MLELTALGASELCGLDVRASRDEVKLLTPDGSVIETDRHRFAKVVARALERRH